MAKKNPNNKKELKKYDLKIPYALYKFIDRYIDDHENLGYSNVSQYLNELVRLEVKRLMKEEKENKD